LRVVGVEPVCGRNHTRRSARLPAWRAGNFCGRPAPEKAGVDDPASEVDFREMMMQIRNPKDEIRKKPEAGTPKTAALTVTRSRSAELHSAVSQICNLRRVGKGQRV